MLGVRGDKGPRLAGRGFRHPVEHCETLFMLSAERRAAMKLLNQRVAVDRPGYGEVQRRGLKGRSNCVDARTCV